QTRFIAAQLWCDALRGEEIDEVVRRAGDLTDRTLPAVARGYAVAAASLAEADGGLLAPARARLEARTNRSASTRPAPPRDAGAAGRPDPAPLPSPPALPPAPPPVDGLRRITARWAAYDAGDAGDDPTGIPDPAGGPPAALAPVEATLAAWKAPDRFAEA